LTNANAQGFCS